MSEKRQYVRMNTVFPVEVEFAKPDEAGSSGGLLQGFTRDVSAGGMCVELKSFDKETEKLFLPDASLLLTINPTFTRQPIRAAGRIAWLRKEDLTHPPRYFIGVAYTQIDDRAKRRIFFHARKLLWMPRLVIGAGCALVLLLSVSLYGSQRLYVENRRLVDELVESASKKSDVASNLYQLQKRKLVLDDELSKARETIRRLQISIDSRAAAGEDEIERTRGLLASALKKQQAIDSRLTQIRQGREKLEATYKTLSAETQADAGQAVRKMYEWLLSHRNLKTGLVGSYEGDARLDDWAFTYDQSLACQTFLVFHDNAHAAEILEFYADRAATDKGAFFNAYDTVDGSAQENVVHTGPNVWLGIAAIQYQHQTKDGRFLPLARRIGNWVLSQQDTEGGVKGGPTVMWYSTEHNLDAYAFFSMLFRETGDKKFAAARDASLRWIKKYAFSQKERRMNRGKGDSTIATDTFSWAVAAIGPATLKEIEFDPEEIMDFAEKNCRVTVSFTQPNGKTAKATGFDFAKVKNLGRGGVISTEWTAQVVVTYQVLARYFESQGNGDRAALYREKANFYLNELQKLIITSPSRTGQGRGCLPYASTDNVDTGHGWRTPQGKRTGSVAGTAYGIFAWIGYNPFDLDNQPRIPL